MSAFPRRAARDRVATRRAGMLLPPTLAVLLLGAACAGASGDESADESADEEPVTMEVNDPFAQADLATLSQASAMVVHGTVVDAEPGLRLGEDTRLRYTAFTVEVDETLAGESAQRVRVVLSTHVDDQEIAVEGRPLPRVGDEGIWFLNPVAPEFGYDGYVLTGQTGLLLVDGDEVVGGGVPGESPIADEVQPLDSPRAVVDHVRAAAE
jgi:hypothetical protein